MKIVLHNPAHNGDILFGSKIIDIIVKSNPNQEFIISPSCSTVLFEHLKSENVVIQMNDYQWVYETNIFPDKDNYLFKQHDILWSVSSGSEAPEDSKLYINIWQIMCFNRNNNMNLVGRIEVINNLFLEIKNKTGVELHFNAKHYTELVPEIPQLDTSYINNYMNNRLYDKRIFFFNLKGCSGSECFPPNFNNDFIKQLLNENPQSLVIVPDTCTIKHARLISLMDDLNIKKEASGKSLVNYANICNLCDEVYFKNNGGSLFTFNVVNIQNKKVKYYFLNGHDEFYHIMKNVYGLNIVN